MFVRPFLGHFEISDDGGCRNSTKAELLQEGISFLIHLFAKDVLVMKKLEFRKISPLLLYQF